MSRRLACVVAALLVSACGLPFTNPAPEYGFITVSAGGSALLPGSNDVPPTLDLRLHAAVAFRPADVTASLDKRSLTLATSGSDLVGSVAPLPLASAHHLDVTIADRAQGISIDFDVIAPTAATLAAHIDPNDGLVVDGDFAGAPSQQRFAAAVPGSTPAWTDPTHVRVTWHGPSPGAIDLPSSLPTARGSHLAAPMHLDLVGIAQGSLRRITVPSAPVVKGVNLVAFVINSEPSNTSLALHQGVLDWVSPTGWTAQQDGTILGTPDQSAVARAQAARLPVWPSLENDPGNPASTTALLGTPAAVTQLVSTAVQAVTGSGYAGINLDFEGMAESDKAPFTAFVQALATALHTHSAQLAVDVVPHDSGGVNRFSAAYDVAAIGAAADVVDVMAYDQHGEGGNPGPVAGLDWDTAQLATTLVGLSPARTLLGIPLYARSWTNGVGESLTYAEAIAQLSDPGARMAYDFGAQTPYIESADGSTMTFFDDADSLARKVALARKEHLDGVAAWRLGFEDPSFWSLFG